MLGMTVWFILRWIFYISLYLIAFTIGGMDGPILYRLQNLPLPRISIQPRSGFFPIQAANFNINYFTVLTGTFLTSAEAAAHQSRLAAARIKSHVVIQYNRYYVCVGKYFSAKEANSTFERVRKKGFFNAIVVGPVQ